MISKGFTSYRIVILASGLFVCFAGLGARLVWLHVIDRESLLKTIAKVRVQITPELARRGDIVDRNGALLATSSTRRVLGVDPSALRVQDQKQWPRLATLLGLPEPELRRLLLTQYREASAGPASPLRDVAGSPVPAVRPGASAEEDEDTRVESAPDALGRRAIRWVKLRDDVPEQLYEEIAKLDIKGVYGVSVARRAYPNQHLAAHLLGYVNRQQAAVAGMEAYVDFFLKGQNGWRVGERDGRNRELPQFLDRRVPPSDGYSVMLSIDTIVQDLVEQELAYIAATFEPLKATIIVSEPHTGFILAMANYPTFDPNRYNEVPKAEEHRMKNVAVADVYEPGSVFKIVAIAGALEAGLVSTSSVFDCTLDRFFDPRQERMLSMPGEDHRFPNPTEVSLFEAVSDSSNRAAGQMAIALGEERFYNYARAFGFGGKLGFPVGGEVSGILEPYKRWDPIDITRIAIGHTIAATALQMHQAMTVIANDGVLLQPQIIRQVRDAAGEVVFRYDRSEVRRVISPQTARLVAQLLTGVPTAHGTAVGAAIADFDVAGKTGTTIKLMETTLANGKPMLVYNRKHHVASFVGFFPASRPRVAISVIVDDADHKAPGGVAYGGKVAAPSFRRIGERLISILNIQPDSHLAPPSLIAAIPGGRP